MKDDFKSRLQFLKTVRSDSNLLKAFFQSSIEEPMVHTVVSSRRYTMKNAKNCSQRIDLKKYCK